MVTLMLELYQGAVAALAQVLPVGDAGHLHLAATGVALAVNAFTQQPVRKWLERLIDRPYWGRRRAGESHPHVRRTHPAAVAER